MKILFLCTHNSCRSILSEAIFNYLAPQEFKAYSAGSFPSGQVNPLTLAALARAGIATTGFSSKSTEVFDTLAPNIVITVCDKAAGEPCPLCLGNALRAHWNLEDPSALALGSQPLSDAEIIAVFDTCMKKIKQRVNAFLALPLDTLALDPVQIQTALNGIGEL